MAQYIVAALAQRDAQNAQRAAQIQKAGEGIASAIGGWQKMASQYAANAAAAKAMADSGLLPQSIADQLATEKNQDKISGLIMAAQPMMESQLSQNRQIAVAKAAEQFMPQVVDLGNGMSAVTTSRGGAQVIQPKNDAKAAEQFVPQVVDLGNGVTAVTTSQKGAKVLPVPRGGGAPNGANGYAAAALDAQIANLSGEVARGNKQWGPDWIPFVGSYADELRALEAKRQSLRAADQQSQERKGASNQYIKGRSYAGMVYLGGDPNQPTSWK